MIYGILAAAWWAERVVFVIRVSGKEKYGNHW
jgi:hypothetical protein